MATRIVPKTRLRERIRAELADLADDTLVVTENGAPLAVMVSVGRWNAIQESIEDLEDRVAVLEHRAGPSLGRDLDAVAEDLETDVPGSTRQPG